MRQAISTLLMLAIVLIAAMRHFVAMPPSARDIFPARLSASEIKEIEAAIRRERYSRTVRYLRDGEFTEAWRWLSRSRAQKIWDAGEQGDGGIWLHVGTDQDTAQKSMTGQFILGRKAGKWVITASNF